MVIQLAAHLLLLTKGEEYLTTTLTHDDTYYYLETVWNHRTLGFPTFDGIHKTNGFHFLWYLLLLGVSYLLPSKMLLLPISIALCSVLNALSYLLILNLGKRSGYDFLAIILSLLWFISNITPMRNIIGMENSLHSLVSWWVIYETFIFFKALRAKEPPNLIRLILSLIAMAYTRMDTAFYSAIIFIVCVGSLYISSKILRRLGTEYGRPLIISVFIVLIAMVVQFGLNWKWGDTLIPLSGIIKISGILPDPGYTALGKGRIIFNMGLPLNLFPWAIYPFLFAAAVSIGIYLWRKFQPSALHYLMVTLLLFFVGSIFFSFHLWQSPAREVSNWYFASLKVNWIFCIGLICYFLCSAQYIHRYLLLRQIIIGVVLMILCLQSINQYSNQLTIKPDPETLYEARYQAALWIKQNIPEQDLISSWNAGQLGFFSGHRVVNLDGLVNDKLYFNTVLKGKLSLASYLRNERVKYLVDYYDYTQDGIFKHLTWIKSFPVKDAKGGEPIRVWDLSTLPADMDVGYYTKQP